MSGGCQIFKQLWATMDGRCGIILLLMISIPALFAPLLIDGDPLALKGPALLPPFTDLHLPLGTDQLGRSVAAQLLYGARGSLTIGLTAAMAAVGFGVFIGTLSGFAGGVIDEVLMRITEAFQTIPGFLLALALVSIAGPSLWLVIIAIALSSWTDAARLMRAQVLSVRSTDYVANAWVIGMRPWEIAFRQVLPNALPPVLILVPVIVAAAILIEAALSFLGLGDPNRVTWGRMIAEGRSVLRIAPFLSLIPGAALMLSVVAVYLLGEGLGKLMRRQGQLS